VRRELILTAALLAAGPLYLLLLTVNHLLISLCCYVEFKFTLAAIDKTTHSRKLRMLEYNGEATVALVFAL
jgi:hypothetical protein